MKQRSITPLLALVFTGAILTISLGGCHQSDGSGSAMLPTATTRVNPTATLFPVRLPEDNGSRPQIDATATVQRGPTATLPAVRMPENNGSRSGVDPTATVQVSPTAPLRAVHLPKLRGLVDLSIPPGYTLWSDTALLDGSGAYGGVSVWRRDSDWIVLLNQASDKYSTHSLVKAAISFSGVPPKARLYTLGCRLIGDETSYHPERDSIVAIGVAGGDYWNRRLLWAAYARIAVGEFAEIPPESVECENLSLGSD